MSEPVGVVVQDVYQYARDFNSALIFEKQEFLER